MSRPIRRHLVAMTATAALAPCLPAVTPSPAVAAPSDYAPGTTISHTVSQQVMVADRTSGTRGIWARYEWRGPAVGWVRLDGGRSAATFGRGGVVPAAKRVINTSTTPAGTFGFLMAFGVGNPGTKLPYRRVTGCSWWNENPKSSMYNRWVESCKHWDDSEHLADYIGSYYRQAAVMDYNYTSRIRSGGGSGAGIFLHYAPLHTGGCVGLTSMPELTDTIRWLDPAKHPLIVVKA